MSGTAPSSTMIYHDDTEGPKEDSGGMSIPTSSEIMGWHVQTLEDHDVLVDFPTFRLSMANPRVFQFIPWDMSLSICCG